jgi:hypothetical protein
MLFFITLYQIHFIKANSGNGLSVGLNPVYIQSSEQIGDHQTWTECLEQAEAMDGLE